MKTLELTLTGRVQGVGMRFFVNRTANRLGVKGFVKNLYSGQVLAVIQGESDLLDTFVDYLKKHSPGTIDHIAFNEKSNAIVYKKFQVKFF